jgi:peptidoglycan-associated lipoprotein
MVTIFKIVNSEKQMRIQVSLLVLTAALLSGCPAEPTKDDNGQIQGQIEGASDTAQTGQFNDGRTTGGTAMASSDEPYRKDAINDANSPLSQQVVYFDFNADTIKAEYNELLVWHGRYLASNQDMKVRLEGHTDERGTREYNIALADRRAQAVSRLLLFQGAKNTQIDVISYGEEKPVALEHDESAWSQNRRVQLVYEAK